MARSNWPTTPTRVAYLAGILNTKALATSASWRERHTPSSHMPTRAWSKVGLSGSLARASQPGAANWTKLEKAAYRAGTRRFARHVAVLRGRQAAPGFFGALGYANRQLSNWPSTSSRHWNEALHPRDWRGRFS